MTDLDRFIDARRNRAFEYFANDCASLAADWVRERTGRDPMAPLRADAGALAQRRLLTALRHVRAKGGFEAVARGLLGEPKGGLLARRGDVVLARSGGRVRRVSGFSFGICTGTHIAAPSLRGLAFLPVTEAVAAWEVR